MKKIIASAIYLALSLIMLAYSAYAWFTNRVAVTNIIISTGNIEVSATLKAGRDYDFDGIVDINQDGSDSYFEIGGEEFIEIFSDLQPGDIVSFKLEITNEGSIDGILNIFLRGFFTEDSYTYGDLKDVFMLYSVNGDTSFGKYLGNIEDNSALEPVYTLPGVLKSKQNENRAEVFFALKFLTLDELKTLNPDVFSEKQNLEDYKSTEGDGKKFLMNIMVELRTVTQEIPSD